MHDIVSYDIGGCSLINFIISHSYPALGYLY